MDPSGKPCRACGRPITGIRYGMVCDRCGIVVHNHCLKEMLRCPECGGDLIPGTQTPADGHPLPALASRRERLTGQILDSLVAAVALIVAMTVGEFVTPLREVAPAAGLAGFVLYYLLADGLGQGQSVGKRVTETAVIDATTRVPCTFARSFVRNLSLMVLGILDVAFIFGPRRQRLGDKFANTLVIKVVRTNPD